MGVKGLKKKRCEWWAHMRTKKNLLPKQFVKIIVKKFVNIALLLKKINDIV